MADNFINIKSGLNIPSYPDLISLNAISNPKPGDCALVNGFLYIYNDTVWNSIGAVYSVNEKIGNVNLTTIDIPEDPSGLYYTDTRAKTAAIVDSTSGSQTDQAASVSAMKNYINSEIGIETSNRTLADSALVSKSGDSITGNLTFSNGSGIESTSDNSELNIGTTSYTHSVNIGTGSHASSINIGTGTGTSTINIGAAGDTVNINGELTYVGVSNLNVTDKDINLNVGGPVASGESSGVHVEEGGIITGYVHVANSRNSWEIKSPAKTGTIQITPSNNAFNTEIVSSSTSNRTITLPDLTGTIALTSQLNNYILNSEKATASGIATLDINSKLTLSQLPNLTTANIPEDPSGLYYTDARAKTAAVVNSTSGTQTDQSASVSAMKNYAISISEKAAASGIATLDINSKLTLSQFPDSIAKPIIADPIGSSSGSSGSIRLKELAANGNNYVSFKAPDLINADTAWTLPSQDGTIGQVLATDGAGILEWRTSGTIASTDTVAAAGYALNPSSVNTKTTSYTLTSLDNGKVIVMDSSSPVNLTIPSGLSVGFNCMIIQTGAGQVTLVASGTTLNSVNGLKISVQHGSVSVMSYAFNVFNISGNVTF